MLSAGDLSLSASLRSGPAGVGAEGVGASGVPAGFTAMPVASETMPARSL